MNPLSQDSRRQPAALEGRAETMNNNQPDIENQRLGYSSRAAALAFLAAAFLGACATTGTGGGQVVERAQARWDAVVAGDLATAYQYLSPGYRSSRTAADYELSMRLRKVQFRDAEYLEQECQEDSCILKFSVQYHIASPVPGLDKWESRTVLDETWIRTEGQWWFVPND